MGPCLIVHARPDQSKLQPRRARRKIDLGVPFYGLGITLAYHRLLAHRSLVVPEWLEHGLVLFAQCSLQDTPAKWVTVHRIHHAFSDEQQDPHSPLVNFFWSHLDWLFYH